jgi:hypothetical protein
MQPAMVDIVWIVQQIVMAPTVNGAKRTSTCEKTVIVSIVLAIQSVSPLFLCILFKLITPLLIFQVQEPFSVTQKVNASANRASVETNAIDVKPTSLTLAHMDVNHVIVRPEVR